MTRFVGSDVKRLRLFPVLLFVLASIFAARSTGALASDDIVTEAFESAVPSETGAPTNSLVLPLIDPARGRTLFINKGCILCHSVNGVGGKVAPALDVLEDERHIDPFAFMARMWRGANLMIALQNEELGYQIEFEGDELAAIVGFAYDVREQSKLTIEQVPQRLRDLFVDEPFEGWVGAPLEPKTKLVER